jgi:hypothetical protein
MSLGQVRVTRGEPMAGGRGNVSSRYGGSSACNILYPCRKCQLEDENLKCRQRAEKNAFVQVSVSFTCCRRIGPSRPFAFAVSAVREHCCRRRVDRTANERAHSGSSPGKRTPVNNCVKG